MGMGSRMIVSSAYWGSSDSDDDDYYIPPTTNTMARKKKTKVVVPVKKALNAWQEYIKSNYDKVRLLPNKERFRALSKMCKIDNKQ
jgi:hypothetical protein